MEGFSPEQQIKLKTGALEGRVTTQVWGHGLPGGTQPGRGAKTQPALTSNQRAWRGRCSPAATDFTRRDHGGYTSGTEHTSPPQAKQAGVQSHPRAAGLSPLRQCRGLRGGGRVLVCTVETFSAFLVYFVTPAVLSSPLPFLTLYSPDLNPFFSFSLQFSFSRSHHTS